ncbi:MAG: hypothetical protein ABIM45_04270 [candidate division WOR-3 bacterium]
MKVFKIVVVIMSIVLGFASAENPSEIRTTKDAAWLHVDKSQVPVEELYTPSPGISDESVRDLTQEATKSSIFQKGIEMPEGGELPNTMGHRCFD